jgi:hypothetical protein
MKKALALLDEILDASLERDSEDKRSPHLRMEDKIGESFITFHLKSLRELLKSEEQRAKAKRDRKSN